MLALSWTRVTKLTTKAAVLALSAGSLSTGFFVFAPAAPANASSCSTTATGFADGDGTSGDPYQISTHEELIYLSLEPTYWSSSFIQTEDIVLPDCEWSPIGSQANKFTGTYNADGHSISGMKINRTSGTGASTEDIGFFGSISGATIKNLEIVGTIVSNRFYVGGLAGRAYTPAVSISKVLSKVDITYTGGNYAGGILGASNSGAMEYSAYRGNFVVNGTWDATGGLVGVNASPFTAVDSYAITNYSGTSAYKGGLFGHDFPRATRSYGVSPGADYGITASTQSGLLTSSFWDSESGPAAARRADPSSVSGATGLSTLDAKKSSTYSTAGWSIVDGWEPFSSTGTLRIWGICSNINDGYPFLLWEYSSDPCLSAPGAPIITTVTAGNTELTVEFTAPTSNGGSVITNYKFSTDNGVTWTAVSPATTTSPIVISGLTNGTNYQVKIRAVNVIGDGTPTAASSVTTLVPAPPSSGSSGADTAAPILVPEAALNPKIVRQPTVRQAIDNRPARLLGKSLNKDVVFVADSSRLSAVAKKSLRQAARLARASGGKVAVTGFAAVTGRGSAYEKSVAQKRALAVARYLRKQGVENWIYYHGLSGRQGLIFEGNPRRVEIRIMK